ncbi:GNAT family N-acetyltransferase [Streptomyces spectabilis]|uniref:Lysine N-acyltransferase MbtK n=1 Tax=Streptomyces spectabilis TaxID=68270 RepID=A0A5P2X6S4_STRST|nr:GNAT family N-acetyltransferase [Streptomyces spectabilis]MBB5106247.1 RimJ/RimL family protein N-acetyltransferase [Streptomyces spectabilis]MCI3902860.1 acetyltransferase [Streptomyces spectabilis]QEV60141.1 N-acetyltransferase [Streptomyces spectabilis]GGV33844.1 acetyltransferase [Streptomyces spectabilis]
MSTFGTLTLRPLDPFTDAQLIHPWMTHPRSVFWPLWGARLHEVERAYMHVAAEEHHDAFVGLRDGEPAFLVERYDPRHVELADAHEPEPGDVGLRFLVAPGADHVEGFGQAALTTVLEHLFADPRTARVVVATDVADHAAQELHEVAGFVPGCEADGPEGRVLLCFCTRERFDAAVVRRAVAARPALTAGAPV